MAKHPHVLLTAPGKEWGYTSPKQGGGAFKTPLRDDRCAHARKLLCDVGQARRDARAAAEETGHLISNLCLEIVGEQGYDLKIESLEEIRRGIPGIEVRSVQRRDDGLHVTIYVPSGKLRNFVKKIERYEREDTKPRKTTGRSRPKHEDLVAGISGIRFPVLHSFWTDDDGLFPRSEDERIWWEVWIRIAPGEPHDDAFAAFVGTVAGAEFQFSQHVIRFPERLVFLAYGSRRQWTRIFVPILDRLAELRRAKEVPTGFLDLTPAEQGDYVNEFSNRIRAPGIDAPAVCVLDYGVHAAHPLLKACIDPQDAQALDPTWGAVDRNEPHGTEMAGLALFGDKLAERLLDNALLNVGHRLESVRIFRTGQAHPPDAWGAVTQQGLALAEQRAPNRRRVACLAATANDDGRDTGRPSSWSAALDEHASGYLDEVRRLYVVAAGNVRNVINAGYNYPHTNFTTGRVEDPGQSWNALTVGAFTDRVHIRSAQYGGYRPLALRGGLCPSSRTSCGWNDQTWPVKPDIVMEGGNYACSPNGQIDRCDDLSLLTTTGDASTGRLLTWMSDTSAATAQAARYAAILAADYPQLWPETIRGLLVHSASWTNAMLNQVPGSGREDRRRRLRCFGYGVPDLDRARYTVENHVSLVHQGEFQPFKLVGSTVKTNHFVLHSPPWPRAALAQLHDQDATVRITLSYFIEPSPAGRGWDKKFRYASHELRFKLRGPTETESAFRRRISSEEWDEGPERPSTKDPIDGWAIGSSLRTRGSIHCDWWTASGAAVASCGQVAVYPVTGWWRERKHLGRVESRARYALIITISTPVTDVDLYTPIAQQVGLVAEIDT